MNLQELTTLVTEARDKIYGDALVYHESDRIDFRLHTNQQLLGSIDLLDGKFWLAGENDTPAVTKLASDLNILTGRVDQQTENLSELALNIQVLTHRLDNIGDRVGNMADTLGELRVSLDKVLTR